ncbi:uncharacterized protein [Apostichopus japonicus]|uniref:uncharacterized protein isoform X2 n=1 Tax=Stichopus japonicus TaxID=307972 RepID=UPI003AB72FAF
MTPVHLSSVLLFCLTIVSNKQEHFTAAAWTGEEEQLCFHVEIVSQKTVRYNCVSCEENKDIVNIITFPLEDFSTTSLTRFDPIAHSVSFTEATTKSDGQRSTAHLADTSSNANLDKSEVTNVSPTMSPSLHSTTNDVVTEETSLDPIAHSVSFTEATTKSDGQRSTAHLADTSSNANLDKSEVTNVSPTMFPSLHSTTNDVVTEETSLDTTGSTSVYPTDELTESEHVPTSNSLYQPGELTESEIVTAFNHLHQTDNASSTYLDQQDQRSNRNESTTAADSLPLFNTSTESIIKATRPGCESWFHSGPESINSCYLVSSFSTTWDVALGICQFFDSHLLFIETAEEMDYSLSMLNSSTGAWIGLNDIATEGRYSWEDKKALNPSSYVGWALSPSNDMNLDCVYVSPSSYWQVDHCGNPKDFICERDYERDYETDCLSDGISNFALGSCYYKLPVLSDWSEATFNCDMFYGGHLVFLDSSQESEFVSVMIPGSWFNDLHPGLPSDTYSYWVNGESFDQGPCVLLINGDWVTTKCNEKHYSICEVEQDHFPLAHINIVCIFYAYMHKFN